MLSQILEILSKSNVFLTGGGGVGKSFLTSAIIKEYRKNAKNVVVLGSTGISAVNIGGVSVHSFFCFGICKDLNELASFDKKQKDKLTKLYSILKNADLIVLDEVSMISPEVLEMIWLRLSVSDFDGRVLFVGDFYQLPPVKKQSVQTSLFEYNYAFMATAWSEFKLVNVELKISKRTKDKVFYEHLSRLRLGQIDDELLAYISSFIVQDFVPDENVSVLFGTNAKVDNLNTFMLNSLDQKEICIQSKLEVDDPKLNEKRLESFKKSLNIPENLYLKIGAKIIFVANKWGDFYNGEQGRVVEFVEKNGEISSIIVKKDDGEFCEVERMKFTLSAFESKGKEIEEVVLASVSQYPFKLAYAMTIHKSQGMSIKNLMCDLSNIFANGQLYVALSRAIDPANLRLFYNRSQDFRRYLQNVVSIDKDVENFYKNSEFLNIREKI
ncbi:MAG: AAA family ATPase [Campylobacter sp.]|nr:AAA family ATPase [Campylobacter sp.]